MRTAEKAFSGFGTAQLAKYNRYRDHWMRDAQAAIAATQERQPAPQPQRQWPKRQRDLGMER